MSRVLRLSPFILKSGAGMLSLHFQIPILVDNEQERVLNIDLHAAPCCELLHYVK